MLNDAVQMEVFSHRLPAGEVSGAPVFHAFETYFLENFKRTQSAFFC